MRNYSFTPSASRVVAAKVVFTDTLPVFSAGDVNDNGIVDWTSYDADEYNGGVVRVAILGGFVHYQIIETLAELNDPDNHPWIQTELEVKAGSKIGLFHNRAFYQGADGHVYFVDLVNGELETPIDMYTSTETLALAPTDWEVVYATYLQTANIKRIVRIIGGDSEEDSE